MKHPVRNTILIIIVLFVAVIQFFPVDNSNPQTDPSKDFMVVKNPSRKITAMIKTSCYDCHSYKTRYPWYSDIAPFSWLLESHIRRGREHLNFSEFADYSRDESNHAIEEMKEVIDNNEMPLKSYVLIHKKARLTEEMRGNLSGWLSSGKNEIQEP